MNLRQIKESREDRDLASYAMKSVRSRGRKYPESEDSYRTIYERDRDRIIHSNAFRRLEYKTQVFANYEGDYYRTRLTHSLETAQIARSLATALRLNEPLAEATAIAHDLGHPPFGHAGEDTLHELMKEHGGFRHNRQVLRLVDLLEMRSPAYDGLNLSYELRESLLKAEKKSAPEAVEFEPRPQYLLEAQIVDLADSTAYNHHDVDDGIRSGILTEEQMESLALWKRARADAEKHYPGLKEGLRRKRILNSMLGICIHDLIDESLRRIEEQKIQSVDDVREHKWSLIGHSDELKPEVAALQRFLLEKFYRHDRVMKERERTNRMLVDLFQAYERDSALLPQEWQDWSEKAGMHRSICDYISGMTDRFAVEEHQRLFGQKSR